MSRKRITLFSLAFKGNPLAKILARTTSRGETLIKPLKQPSVHLSIFTSEDNEIRRHVADETRRGKRRYTKKAVVRPEKVILLFLAAIAPEDNPPPQVGSFADPEHARAVGDWLSRVWPKVTRKTEDRPVRILKGPMAELAELIDSARMGRLPEKPTLDVASILEYIRSTAISSEKEPYALLTETDLRLGEPRVAITPDLQKLVICVDEGVVLEVDPDRLVAAVMEMSRLLGVSDLLSAIHQKGHEIVDKRGIDALQEWESERR